MSRVPERGLSDPSETVYVVSNRASAVHCTQCLESDVLQHGERTPNSSHAFSVSVVVVTLSSSLRSVFVMFG